MLVDVTQNLQVRITPVNNPAKGDGWYRAVVTHDYSAMIQASHETAAGKEPTVKVGYGEHRVASAATLKALWDYEEKFGDLCVTDTDNEFGD